MNNIENNFKVLLNLKENDQLIIDGSQLKIQYDNKDYNIIDNKHTFYQTIISTLLYILHVDFKYKYKINVLNNVEDCLDNIYNNYHIANDLESNEDYDRFFDNVHAILHRQNLRYRYNDCNRFFYTLVDTLDDTFNRFLFHAVSISKAIVYPKREIYEISDSDEENESEEEEEEGEEEEEETNSQED